MNSALVGRDLALLGQKIDLCPDDEARISWKDTTDYIDGLRERAMSYEGYDPRTEAQFLSYFTELDTQRAEARERQYQQELGI